MPPSQEFLVPPALAGERLDRALVELLEGVFSRTRVQELIQDGGVRLDGLPTQRPSQLLVAGQRIELCEVPRSRIRPGGPAGGELHVLHEDEHLAVLDKPAGQLCHPTTIVQGQTVSELATARWGELPTPQGEDRPGIVHRLDADTSGLMLLAKSPAAAEALVEAFRARRVEKRYLALVAGDPRFDSDWIDAPIGRSVDRSDRMRILSEGEGKPAQTFYRVVERFARYALLECRPKTGRTHQIRVHLASIDLPILGDRVYPGRKSLPIPKSAPDLGRHLLHASGLRFAHPIHGNELEFESNPPPVFQAWLDWLRTSGVGPGDATAVNPGR